MATEAEPTTQQHGGRLIAARLKAYGVTKLFTLSGGHLFSIYDGCRAERIDIVDVRHEQSAAFAAEGWAKVTRTPGVCALTAGPGVTNGMSAIASAHQNHSPMLVLGGRAPQFRWGQGSLQEIDHVPFVRPLVKFAATAQDTEEIPALIDQAVRTAVAPHSGPTFVDLPLDYVFGEAATADPPAPLPDLASGPGADRRAIDRAAALVRDSERPVIMAGAGLYWGRGETALRSLAERLRIPVFANGLARGCIPADHELAFSRARRTGLQGTDLAVVIGAPLDFRLGFGGAFAPDAAIIAVDLAEPAQDAPRHLTAELYGALPATLETLREAASHPEPPPEREAWIRSLRATEDDLRAGEKEELADDRAPLHPMRVFGELNRLLDRDAIVVGDGGDFVSYAGRLIDSYAPGCWLDPGPLGCLGCGPGYALAAKLAHPARQVVLLLGDGAFGFSGMEFDTLARHGVAVLAIVGNNGIWALEKHPMEALYGYSVAAELQLGTRYDEIAEALGCHGELVQTPRDLHPALERALASGRPALVNVLTDPSVAYPRRSNLA
ncbi:MAG: acetolactate synthase [Solirubrobacterales bacterium]|nr:acetolactate synthase [Solirubrobacterales bacterium]